MKITNLILAAAVAGSAMTAVPAAAVQVVFANVTANNGLNFRWLRGTGAGNGANATFGTTATPSSNTLGGNALVTFSLSGAPVPLSTNAILSLSGTTSGDAVGVTSGDFSQNLDSFSFTIRAQNAFNYANIAIAANDVLLSGTVLNGAIQGSIGGTTGSLVGSAGSGSTVNFGSSPLFTFLPATTFAFTFNMGGIAPTSGTGFTTATAATALSTFRAQVGGSLQSDPAPQFVAVPEPATWAMMIVGMGLVGFARRRRSTVVAA